MHARWDRPSPTPRYPPVSHHWLSPGLLTGLPCPTGVCFQHCSQRLPLCGSCHSGRNPTALSHFTQKKSIPGLCEALGASQPRTSQSPVPCPAHPPSRRPLPLCWSLEFIRPAQFYVEYPTRVSRFLLPSGVIFHSYFHRCEIISNRRKNETCSL